VADTVIKAESGGASTGHPRPTGPAARRATACPLPSLQKNISEDLPSYSGGSSIFSRRILRVSKAHFCAPCPYSPMSRVSWGGEHAAPCTPLPCGQRHGACDPGRRQAVLAQWEGDTAGEKLLGQLGEAVPAGVHHALEAVDTGPGSVRIGLASQAHQDRPRPRLDLLRPGRRRGTRSGGAWTATSWQPNGGRGL